MIFSVIIIFNSNSRIVNFIISTEILIYAIIMFITIKKSLNLYYKQKLLENEVKETKEVTEKEEIKEEKPELDLNILTVAELRDLAKKKEIKGYSKMKKEELINALN